MRTPSMLAHAAVLALLLAGSPPRTTAATTVGVLPGNETWSGTVSLTGDVTVPANATLTILPGTRVRCDARADTPPGGPTPTRTELIVNGILVADGTAASPITFTSWPAGPNDAPLAGDWGGIHLNHATKPSTLRNCVVEYATDGLRVTGATPVLDRLVFRNNHGIAIAAYKNIQIAGSSFAAGEVGIEILNGAAISVTDSEFRGLVRGILHLPGAASAVAATRCTFDQSQTGVDFYAEGGFLRIADCLFRSNRVAGVSAGQGSLDKCSISNSVFEANGTGVAVADGQSLRSVGCTVRGSQADAFGHVGFGTSGVLQLVGTSILRNGGFGVVLNSECMLDSCEIRDNGRSGVQVGPLSAKNSTILNNGGAGLAFTKVATDGIHGCVILNNGTGLENHSLSADAVPDGAISTNHISGNGSYDVFQNAPYGHAVVFANNNYWGPTTTAELQSGVRNLTRIYDSRDNGDLGPVVIASWLGSWPPCTEITTITAQPQDQVAPVGGSTTFSVTATGFNLRYQWRTGSTLLAGSTGPQLNLANLQESQARADYNVVVTGDCGSVTSRLAALTLLRPPAITVQPTNLVLLPPGTTARFHIAAEGTAPLTYRWQRNNVDLIDTGRHNGTGTPDLTISGITAAEAGTYRCRVSNGVGSAISQPAELSLLTPPVIVTQPISQVALPGDQVQFTVAATGAQLTYQWYKDGIAIPGAITPDLLLPAAQANQVGKYTVKIANPAQPNGLSSTAASLGLYTLETCAVITLTGPVGERYVVEWSERLQPGPWQVLTNIVLPYSPYVIVDFDSSHARHRFYQAGVKSP